MSERDDTSKAAVKPAGSDAAADAAVQPQALNPSEPEPGDGPAPAQRPGDTDDGALNDIVGDEGDLVGDEGDLVGDEGELIGDEAEVIGDEGDLVGDEGEIAGSGGDWDAARADMAGPSGGEPDLSERHEPAGDPAAVDEPLDHDGSGRAPLRDVRDIAVARRMDGEGVDGVAHTDRLDRAARSPARADLAAGDADGSDDGWVDLAAVTAAGSGDEHSSADKDGADPRPVTIDEIEQPVGRDARIEVASDMNPDDGPTGLVNLDGGSDVAGEYGESDGPVDLDGDDDRIAVAADGDDQLDPETDVDDHLNPERDVELDVDPDGGDQLDPEGDVEPDIHLDDDGHLNPERDVELDIDPDGGDQLDPEGDVEMDIDPDGDDQLDPEGDVDLDSDDQLDPETDVELDIDLDSDDQLDPETDVDLDSEDQLDPETDVELDIDLDSDDQLDPETDVELDIDPDGDDGEGSAQNDDPDDGDADDTGASRREPSAAAKPRAMAPGAASAFQGERVAKVIARAGVASRRDAEALVEAGRVSVNGSVLDTPAVNVMPSDDVRIDGERIPSRLRTRAWLFHKPRGLVTTNRDPEGRRTVFDALPAGLPRVMTVGRLDINTEGLLLLTNDGGLARVLELPATGWTRKYRARVHGEVDQSRLAELARGTAVDGVLYGPIEVTLDRVTGDNAWLTLALSEGKNREVKIVLGTLGLEVTRLIRVSFGPFQLGELARGDVQEIPTRYLRDQLGSRLAADAEADFEAPLAAPVLRNAGRPAAGGSRPARRPEPTRRSAPEGRVLGGGAEWSGNSTGRRDDRGTADRGGGRAGGARGAGAREAGARESGDRRGSDRGSADRSSADRGGGRAAPRDGARVAGAPDGRRSYESRGGYWRAPAENRPAEPGPGDGRRPYSERSEDGGRPGRLAGGEPRGGEQQRGDGSRFIGGERPWQRRSDNDAPAGRAASGRAAAGGGRGGSGSRPRGDDPQGRGETARPRFGDRNRDAGARGSDAPRRPFRDGSPGGTRDSGSEGGVRRKPGNRDGPRPAYGSGGGVRARAGSGAEGERARSGGGSGGPGERADRDGRSGYRRQGAGEVERGRGGSDRPGGLGGGGGGGGDRGSRSDGRPDRNSGFGAGPGRGTARVVASRLRTSGPDGPAGSDRTSFRDRSAGAAHGRAGRDDRADQDRSIARQDRGGARDGGEHRDGREARAVRGDARSTSEGFRPSGDRPFNGRPPRTGDSPLRQRPDAGRETQGERPDGRFASRNDRPRQGGREDRSGVSGTSGDRSDRSDRSGRDNAGPRGSSSYAGKAYGERADRSAGARDGGRVRPSGYRGNGAGAGRTAAADDGRPSGGVRDRGRPSAGARDGGRPSAGARDGGRPSAGARDGGRPSAGARDGGRPSGGARDGGRPSRHGSDGEKPWRNARDGGKPSGFVGTRSATAGGPPAASRDRQTGEGRQRSRDERDPAATPARRSFRERPGGEGVANRPAGSAFRAKPGGEGFRAGSSGGGFRGKPGGSRPDGNGKAPTRPGRGPGNGRPGPQR